MSNYTQTTNFTALTAANAVINGAAFDLEYGNVATSITSKFDNIAGGYPGPFIMNFAATKTTLTIFGAANSDTLQITGNSTTNESFGISISAGTSVTDSPLFVNNQSNSQALLQVRGDGSVVLGSATGGAQGLGSINASAVYVNGASLLSSGTFTGTLTGCTTAPTATFSYTISGKTVTIYCAGGLVATSNSTACTITGVPAGLLPAFNQTPLMLAEDNTASIVAKAVVGPTPGSGVIELLTLTSGLFTSTGTKGWGADGIITYSLV